MDTLLGTPWLGQCSGNPWDALRTPWERSGRPLDTLLAAGAMLWLAGLWERSGHPFDAHKPMVSEPAEPSRAELTKSEPSRAKLLQYSEPSQAEPSRRAMPTPSRAEPSSGPGLACASSTFGLFVVFDFWISACFGPFGSFWTQGHAKPTLARLGPMDVVDDWWMAAAFGLRNFPLFETIAIPVAQT